MQLDRLVRSRNVCHANSEDSWGNISRNPWYPLASVALGERPRDKSAAGSHERKPSEHVQNMIEYTETALWKVFLRSLGSKPVCDGAPTLSSVRPPLKSAVVPFFCARNGRTSTRSSLTICRRILLNLRFS